MRRTCRAASRPFLANPNASSSYDGGTRIPDAVRGHQPGGELQPITTWRPMPDLFLALPYHALPEDTCRWAWLGNFVVRCIIGSGHRQPLCRRRSSNSNLDQHARLCHSATDILVHQSPPSFEYVPRAATESILYDGDRLDVLRCR